MKRYMYRYRSKYNKFIGIILGIIGLIIILSVITIEFILSIIGIGLLIISCLLIKIK